MDAQSVLPGWWEIYNQEGQLTAFGVFSPEGKFELRKPAQLSEFGEILRMYELTDRRVIRGRWEVADGRIWMLLEEDTGIIPIKLPIISRMIRAYARAEYRGQRYTMQYPVTVVSNDELHTAYGEQGKLTQVWRRRTAPVL
jgi:hypothetical protein